MSLLSAPTLRPNNPASRLATQRANTGLLIAGAVTVALAPVSDSASAQTMFHALQQRAHAAGIPLRAPPPEPTSCCGRGCNGCVWEGFYHAANYWREEALLLLKD